jgi:hypothetical protein
VGFFGRNSWSNWAARFGSVVPLIASTGISWTPRGDADCGVASKTFRPHRAALRRSRADVAGAARGRPA